METISITKIRYLDAYYLPGTPENIYYQPFGKYTSASGKKVIISKVFHDGKLIDIVEHPVTLFVYLLEYKFFQKFDF